MVATGTGGENFFTMEMFVWKYRFSNPKFGIDENEKKLKKDERKRKKRTCGAEREREERERETREQRHGIRCRS